MTPYLTALAAIGTVLWLALGLMMFWSIYALQHHLPTTSQVIHSLPVPLVALFCLSFGLIVGFVFGHWFWPISS